MSWAVVLALAVAATVAGYGQACRAEPPAEVTTADRVEQYGPSARARLLPFFTAASIPYPPTRFLLLGLKRERELQLYAAGPAQGLAFIRSFQILGASGDLGPKLRDGDRQVPEGVYRVVYLNPNSTAHLSLAVSYPNDFDRLHAEEDGREAAVLGGDIMIHGGSDSVGCLAIGDRAAEDLFVLAADAGWEQAVIVISPVDFRRTTLPAAYHPSSSWVNQLYAWLRSTLDALPTPPQRAVAKR
jgi:murein L,D-transpeptidase YafK